MPICITCSTPVRHLYTTYSKADDRTLGKGVRLTQCPNCKRFADKYVEHDYVVLFIDLVLIKPQVYRHLLFNRLGRADNHLDPSILRFGVLLLLFDVYLTWAQIEKATAKDGGAASSPLSDAPILLQYLFFLTMNTIATLAHHMTIRLLVRLFCSSGSEYSRIATADSPEREPVHVNIAGSDGSQATSTGAAPANGRASPSAISTALLVSSCTKLFPILLVIWPTDTAEADGNHSSQDRGLDAKPTFSRRARSYVGWAVLLNNIEALLILLDCGYPMATTLALAGASARWLVETSMLSFVGMASLDEENGPIGVIVWLVWESCRRLGLVT